MNFKSNRIALAVSAAGLISVSQGAAAFDFFNFGAIFNPPELPALVPLLAPKHPVVHADVSTAATQGCIIAAEGIPQGEITGDVLQDCLLALDDYCNGYYGGDPTVLADASIGGEGGACVNTATISQEVQVGGKQQIVLHSTIGYSLADVIKVTEVAGEGTIPDKEGLEIAIAGAGVYARAWVEGWSDSDTGWKPVGANYIGNAAIYGETPLGAGETALQEPSEPLAEGSIFYSTAPFIAAFQNPGCNELGCLVPDKVTVKMEFLTIAVMPGGPFNSYVNGADIPVDIGTPPSGPGTVPALVAVTRGKVNQVIADIEATSGVTLVDYYPDED